MNLAYVRYGETSFLRQAFGEPGDRPWAMRDFTLFDPSGVVWRIAQNLPRT